jgi:hypothetical protein
MFEQGTYRIRSKRANRPAAMFLWYRLFICFAMLYHVVVQTELRMVILKECSRKQDAIYYDTNSAENPLSSRRSLPLGLRTTKLVWLWDGNNGNCSRSQMPLFSGYWDPGPCDPCLNGCCHLGYGWLHSSGHSAHQEMPCIMKSENSLPWTSWVQWTRAHLFLREPFKGPSIPWTW